MPGTLVGMARNGPPVVVRADAASESDDQHAFLLFGQRLSHGGGGEGAEAGDGGAGAGAGHGAKKLATADEVIGAVAGVKE